MGWSRFRKKRDMPEGLWIKCPSCKETLYKKDLATTLNVCTACGHHLRMPARSRVDSLVDENSFRERFKNLRPLDRLGFVDELSYPEKLALVSERTGLEEAAMAGTGTINGLPLSLCVLDFSFMGGSMGTVVGEKVTRTIELATEEGIPALVVSCSGGARMHEGALSLMQMGKTAAALARHNDQGGLYVSVLANPTTGGVMASFAALGDVILAEPHALIGFAGPRVIQETLRTELPEGFQTSEFLLEKGFIDRIVERKDLRPTVHKLMDFLCTFSEEKKAQFAAPPQADSGPTPDEDQGDASE